MKAEVALVLAVLIMAGTLGGVYYIQSATPQQMVGPSGEVGTTTFSVCGDTNLGDPSICAHNGLNTSYHCMPMTARIYQINSDGSYSLISSETLTEGTVATSVTTTLPCKDATGNNIKYRAWFAATDNSGTTDGYKSGYVDFDFVTSAKPTVTFETAKIDEIVLRLYDDTAKAYVYTIATASIGNTAGDIDASVNSTGFQITGADFVWNTTAPGTIGLTDISNLGTDSEINAVLHFKVHATNSTVAQANDGNTYWAVDLQSEDDWDSSVTSMGSLPLVSNVPVKISNLNYDIVYDANSLTPVKGVEKTINFYTKALSGVNPDDDVKLGFFTEGYYVSSSTQSMGLGVSKDDSSKTLVYTEQEWTIRVD